jgi:hypothetical protein
MILPDICACTRFSIELDYWMIFMINEYYRVRLSESNPVEEMRADF